MLIIGWLMDFGMLMRNYEVVTNAAREGARVAILEGYGDADIESRVDQYLAASGLTGARDVTVANVPVTTPAGTFTARSITLDYTYQFAVLPGVGALFGGTFTTVPLRAVAVMRTESQAAPAP
jgi:Flp pilus assembly protein TadG